MKPATTRAIAATPITAAAEAGVTDVLATAAIRAAATAEAVATAAAATGRQQRRPVRVSQRPLRRLRGRPQRRRAQPQLQPDRGRPVSLRDARLRFPLRITRGVSAGLPLGVPRWLRGRLSGRSPRPALVVARSRLDDRRGPRFVAPPQKVKNPAENVSPPGPFGQPPGPVDPDMTAGAIRRRDAD